MIKIEVHQRLSTSWTSGSFIVIKLPEDGTLVSKHVGPGI